jgi:hypothetical protein
VCYVCGREQSRAEQSIALSVFRMIAGMSWDVCGRVRSRASVFITTTGEGGGGGKKGRERSQGEDEEEVVGGIGMNRKSYGPAAATAFPPSLLHLHR